MFVFARVQLVRSGVVTTAQVRAYLQYSEVLRAFLEKYFNLKTPLHFHSTQIVCQSAQKGQNIQSVWGGSTGTCPQTRNSYVIFIE